MVERSVLKTRAKDQLKGNWLVAVVAFVLVTAITGIINLISEKLDSTVLSIICGLIILLISGALSYGTSVLVLNFVRTKKAAISDVFAGFNSKVYFKTIGLMILMGICVIIGFIVLIIPGIILTYMFSQAYFVLIDNQDMSVIDCMKKSAAIMKGHKFEFFVLQISFILWILLGAITCGIGFLWITPYMSVTFGNYYEELEK